MNNINNVKWRNGWYENSWVSWGHWFTDKRHYENEAKQKTKTGKRAKNSKISGWGVIRAGEGDIRAGEGTIRAGQNF